MNFISGLMKGGKTDPTDETPDMEKRSDASGASAPLCSSDAGKLLESAGGQQKSADSKPVGDQCVGLGRQHEASPSSEGPSGECVAASAAPVESQDVAAKSTAIQPASPNRANTAGPSEAPKKDAGHTCPASEPEKQNEVPEKHAKTTKKDDRKDDNKEDSSKKDGDKEARNTSKKGLGAKQPAPSSPESKSPKDPKKSDGENGKKQSPKKKPDSSAAPKLPKKSDKEDKENSGVTQNGKAARKQVPGANAAQQITSLLSRGRTKEEIESENRNQRTQLTALRRKLNLSQEEVELWRRTVRNVVKEVETAPHAKLARIKEIVANSEEKALSLAGTDDDASSRPRRTSNRKKSRRRARRQDGNDATEEERNTNSEGEKSRKGQRRRPGEEQQGPASVARAQGRRQRGGRAANGGMMMMNGMSPMGGRPIQLFTGSGSFTVGQGMSLGNAPNEANSRRLMQRLSKGGQRSPNNQTSQPSVSNHPVGNKTRQLLREAYEGRVADPHKALELAQQALREFELAKDLDIEWEVDRAKKLIKDIQDRNAVHAGLALAASTTA